jgi:hypothetical protein
VIAMPTPESTPEPTLVPPPSRSPLRLWAAPVFVLDAVAGALDRATRRLTTRIRGAAWDVLHVLGAHRWREGWETNIERGWRQYRGSRCTICDVPWEGW